MYWTPQIIMGYILGVGNWYLLTGSEPSFLQSHAIWCTLILSYSFVCAAVELKAQRVALWVLSPS